MFRIGTRRSTAYSRLSRTLFLVLALLLVASLGVGQVQAKATTFTSNQSFDTELFVYIPCAVGGAGEYVYLTGPLHVLFVVTLDARGGYHAIDHFQPQGISGTGLTTGDVYHAVGETLDTFTGKVGTTQSFVNNFKIVGVGPGNNYMVHENFHVTVNANGTVTAFVDNFSIECK